MSSCRAFATQSPCGPESATARDPIEYHLYDSMRARTVLFLKGISAAIFSLRSCTACARVLSCSRLRAQGRKLILDKLKVEYTCTWNLDRNLQFPLFFSTGCLQGVVQFSYLSFSIFQKSIIRPRRQQPRHRWHR